MSAVAAQTTAAPTGPVQAAAAVQPAAGAGSQSTTTQAAEPAAATTEATPAASFLGGLTEAPAAEASKDAGVKPTIDAKPGEAAPFDIKLPEGLDIDKGFLEGFKAVAQAQKMTPEAATGVAAWYAENYQKAVTENAKAAAKQVEDWKTALKTDPDFGGQKLTENAQAAQKAWQRFGGEALLGEVRGLGLEFHPGITKMMAKIGKAMGEDNSAGGGKPPAANDGESKLRSLYPTMFPQASG